MPENNNTENNNTGTDFQENLGNIASDYWLPATLATLGAGGLGAYLTSLSDKRKGETPQERRNRIIRNALYSSGLTGTALAGLGVASAIGSEEEEKQISPFDTVADAATSATVPNIGGAFGGTAAGGIGHKLGEGVQNVSQKQIDEINAHIKDYNNNNKYRPNRVTPIDVNSDSRKIIKKKLQRVFGNLSEAEYDKVYRHANNASTRNRGAYTGRLALAGSLFGSLAQQQAEAVAGDENHRDNFTLPVMALSYAGGTSASDVISGNKRRGRKIKGLSPRKRLSALNDKRISGMNKGGLRRQAAGLGASFVSGLATSSGIPSFINDFFDKSEDDKSEDDSK